MITPAKLTARACFACCVLATRLVAQTPAPKQSLEDETLVLTPFTVQAEKDDGYIAADTTTGGRLSMNLLKAPSDATVLTREFLNDIGALSVLDAASWLTASTVTDIGAQSSASAPDNRDFGGNVSFRGLGNTVNTRDFFTYPTSVNEYIVERLEGSRGSNAIVYGDGGAGGQLNIVTKRAMPRNFGSVRLRTDTNGTLAAAVDVNRKLTNTLAARVNAYNQARRTWIDRYFDDGRGIDLAVTYRPWWGASYRFEGEYARTSRAPFRHVYRDGISTWDHITFVNAPLTANPPAAQGLARYGDKPELSTASPGVINYRNFARSAGNGLTIIDEPRAQFGTNAPFIPRGFRINPPEERTQFRTYNFAVFLEQAFRSGLVVEVAGSANGVLRNSLNFPEFETVYADVNAVLPNGQPNPNKGGYYVEGQYQESIVPEWYNNYRAAAAYPWKTKWFKHTFSVVAMRRDKFSDPRTYGYARIKDPNNPSISTALNAFENQLFFRRYFADADAPLGITPGAASVSIDGYEFVRYNSRNDRQFNRLETVQANLIGEYLDDQVTLVAGIRRDDNLQANRVGTFTNGRLTGNNRSTLNTRATSKNVGLSYFPKQFPAFGIYGNATDGFRPQGTTNPWLRGTPVTVSPSRTYGYGLRMRLFDGKVVGSIGGYQTKEIDSLFQVTGFINQVRDLWTAVGMPERVIVAPFNVVDDSRDTAARGWEADVTVNVTKRFRMKANVAFPKARLTNALPDVKAYFDANLATWQAGRTPENATIIDTNVQNLQNTIASANDGRDINGIYKWRANFFANYELGTGRLKGLRLGLGGNFFGRRLIGNAVGRAYDYIYAEEYFTTMATASYSLKLGRVPVELQLHVNNLLDYDKPVYLGTHVVSNVAIPSYLSYIPPRMGSLTATFRF